MHHSINSIIRQSNLALKADPRVGIYKDLTYLLIDEGVDRPRWSLRYWIGKQANPVKYWSLKHKEQGEMMLNELRDQADRREEYKTKRAQEKKTANLDAIKNYQVGTILVCSWGYDQTNVDFYQVVAVKNKSIDIREIGLISKPNEGCSSMSDQVRPDVGNFIGDVIPNKRVGKYGISINSYQSASICDPEKWHYRSWDH